MYISVKMLKTLQKLCSLYNCIIKTQRHMHFIHSYIKNVSVWDPTAHIKYC